MEGLRLILNDTITIEGGRAGYSGGFLWLFFTGYTLPEAGAIFFDPSNTAKIVFQYGDMEDTYTGYTVCTSLTVDTDEKVFVCMVKGA